MTKPIVLLVTDEPRTRSSLKSALEQRGYRVVVARSGLEAFAAAAKRPIEALITKVELPGVGGSALGKIFSDRFPGLPIVYLDAVPSEVVEQVERLLETANRRKPNSQSAGRGHRTRTA